jgi:membrane protease YdiL (CAAX protease family)
MEEVSARKVALPTKRALTIVMVYPLAVVGMGQLAARLIGPRVGDWSYIPLNIGYWATVIALVLLFGGKKAINSWLSPAQGKWWWLLLALSVSTLPALPMLIDGWHFLLLPQIWIPTIFFVLLNPLAEEFYWRGLLIDTGRAAGWKGWMIVLYSSLIFTLNHMWIGVNAEGARNPMASIFQFVFGGVMSLVYLKTGSLRWPLIGHFLINLLTPTVAVFLNLYVP